MNRLAILVVLLGACGGTPQHTTTPSVAANPPPRVPAPKVGRIVGVVRDGSGAPVDGALVAAVPYRPASADATAPAALVTSNGGGRFRLDGLAPGEYGVTATQLGRVAAYRGNIVVKVGEAADGDVATGGSGATLSGHVRDDHGNPIAGAEVRAPRVSDVNGDVFYTRTDATGAFAVTLPSASYGVLAKAPGRASDPENAPLTGDRTVELVARKIAPAGPAPREVVDWMRAHAVPLATTEAGHGFADLAPLKQMIGDARIVSVGEATHGTREFFQLKHRIFEYLATELGFTIFAIEANWPESLAIDEYVQTGKGDPQKALDGIYFWTWNTEEVLDLIRWMRRYNEDAAHTHKVHFYGFDMQTPTVAAQRVVAYVKQVEPALAAGAEKALAPWSGAMFERQLYNRKSADERTANTVALAELARRFDEAKRRWIGKRGGDAWAIARQQLRIVQQCDEVTAEDAASAFGGEARDRAMAENVRWLAEREPGARMMLWAHNGHVARGGSGMAGSMGSHLARMFGSAMVVFGFAFNQGSFQAMGMSGGKPAGGLRPFTVPPAPPGSLDATLAATGTPLLALDVRGAPVDGTVGEWLHMRHGSRSVGAVFDETAPASFFLPTDLPSTFDVVLFVAQTTRARPNHSPAAPASARPPAATAQNLDLEADGKPGDTPPGWYVPTAAREAGYHAALVDEKAYAGKRCLVVEGKPNGPVAFGNVMQRIDARPYRGKRIRLRAAVRAGGTAPAALWLRVDRKNGALGFFDNMMDRPITASEWRQYEIVGNVDDDAEALAFGMMVIGEGRAWLDAVSIDVIPR